MPRWFALTLATVLTCLLPACGGGGGDGDPEEKTGWYVDGALGNDTNPGTQAEPFKTITHALSVAKPAQVTGEGDWVLIQGGIYDASTETFPLVVPEGVWVQRAPGFAPVTIVGGGNAPTDVSATLTAAVVLRDYASIHHVEITNPMSGGPRFHYGVLIAGDASGMGHTIVSGSQHGGVAVLSGERVQLTNCTIENHPQGIGVHYAGGGINGSVIGSTITNNKIGVEYDAPGGSLGFFANDSFANVIVGNSHTDLWVAPGITVVARYNKWDNAPPTISTSSGGGGVDVYHINGTGGVDLTGAAQYVP
ncbi:MAG: DUF1565 domain-containing protein [Planctomycetota bacterium]|nr:DUF1565 domain-containing protein [Planctomycetota bacterium]